ncbi:MAG: MgtC/SapB family protein [Bacteriovoracaceae bacterium]|nr:MgtC/SapB family protein [Bacteriovoracaceae bacterium]
MDANHFINNYIELEFFGAVPPYIAIGIKIITAIFLGTIIGIDREKKLKSAGVKTQILICLGATLYVTISHLNTNHFGHENGSNLLGDPNRIAAQIVSGIGFLGAGAILHSRGAVYGMTTAATIWVVAAMGVAVGSGYILSAMIFAITTLCVLNIIDPLIRLIQPEKHFLLEITGRDSIEPDISRIMSLLETQVISKEFFSNEQLHKVNLQYHVKVTYKEIKKIVQYLKANPKVEQYTYHSIRENGSTNKNKDEVIGD